MYVLRKWKYKLCMIFFEISEKQYVLLYMYYLSFERKKIHVFEEIQFCEFWTKISFENRLYELGVHVKTTSF